MTNPWDKIFIGEFESAYVVANQNYLETGQDFDLRARARCSLLLRKYENALADFLLLNENEKKSNETSDDTYLYIALCYYAMGNNDKAIEYFKFPVTNSKEMIYTINISTPGCILFYIATKLNRPDILKIALKELKRRKQIIPLFLMGQIALTDLNLIYEQQSNEAYKNREHCKAEFYKAVARLAKGEFTEYKEHLSRCVELRGNYLDFEYYIAKVDYEINNIIT